MFRLTALIGLIVLPQYAISGVTLAPGDILVSDASNFGPGNAIVHINPTTGIQSLIATGGYLVNPSGLVIDQAGSLIVADIDAIDGNGALIRVDPLTGAQAVISSGGYFNDPWGVGLDNSGNIYVADRIALSGPGSVIRVDPATGSQTQVLAGGNFVKPTGIAIDNDGRILVADRNSLGGAVIRVDPVSGAQTVIASGQHLRNPFDVKVLSEGGVVVADADADQFQGAVIKVDPIQGAQSVLSSRGVFVDPHGLAIENSGDILVAGIFDLGTGGEGPYSGGVVRVNPLTGMQTLVSANGYLTNHFGPTGIAVVHQPIGWNIDADGDWSAAENWAGAIPNSTTGHAAFGSVITSPRVVTVNTPIFVAGINFDSSKSYTIAGSDPLTLEAHNARARINVVSGSHSIAAPLTLAGDTAISVGPVTSNLSVSALARSGVWLHKQGFGTLTLNNVRMAKLSIGDGSVAIAPNGTDAGTSVLSELVIAHDSTLDITDNALVMDYVDSPIPIIRSQMVRIIRSSIVAGRGRDGLGATWDGPGISSSAAAAAEPESLSIGYADNSALPLGSFTSFHGQAVDASSVLIAFTRTGDANLDGMVDDDDVTVISASYAPEVPQPYWALGDFDYNGFVDDVDVTLLGAFYNPTSTGMATAPAAVPEPASSMLLIVAVVFFTLRIGLRLYRSSKRSSRMTAAAMLQSR
jgi:sugar lactone lactonase YvrE